MSYCTLTFTGKKDGARFIHRCTACEREYRSKSDKPTLKANCKAMMDSRDEEGLLARHFREYAASIGPGTELKNLLAEYGVKKRKKGCGCDDWIKRMNAWGTKGCDEHRAEILAHLHEAYDLAPFWEKTKAAALAVLKGLPTTLEGIADEALARAMKQQAEQAIQDADAYAGVAA